MTRRLLALVAIGAAAFTLAACTPTKPPVYGTITGQVTDADTAEPIEQGGLTVWPAGSDRSNFDNAAAISTLGSDGRYTVGVPAGSYDLVFATAAGIGGPVYVAERLNVTVGPRATVVVDCTIDRQP